MKLPRTVYAIRILDSTKRYIGSSCNPYKRKLQHESQLRNGVHPVEDFQEDFDNSECKEIAMELLGVINTEEELEKEYDFMRAYGTNKRGNGYNYKDFNCNSKSVSSGLEEWQERILETIADALPKMSERDKGYFLGYAEAMASQNKEEDSKADD